MNSVSDIIPALNNLNIQAGVNTWRLVSTELEVPTILIEATPEGIIVHPVFVQARDLPGATLSPVQVSRIVLGWAPENQAWRLGMLLQDAAATAADTTQLQWCELAAWSNENEPIQRVKIASQSLARLLGRPFQMIEPETQSPAALLTQTNSPTVSLAGSPYVVPMAQSTPPTLGFTLAASSQEFKHLPEPDSVSDEVVSPQLLDAPYVSELELPLRFSDWQLVKTSEGLRWRRGGGWWFVNLFKIILIGGFTIFFFILSLGSQISGFADVEPSWLPLMGIGVGMMLFVTLLYTFGQIFGSASVVIDSHHQEIYERSLLVPFLNWRVSFDQIQYVLITQTPARAQGRRHHADPMRIAQDVWLHIYDGHSFYPIVHLHSVEGRSWDWNNIRHHVQTMVRRRLQITEYDTPAHHAALKIAKILNVPAYIDVAA